jgi:hypothetical protein
MQQSIENKPATFLDRQVSVDQAIKILKRNGIQANEEQACIILDFLYLLAKTCRKMENLDNTIGT